MRSFLVSILVACGGGSDAPTPVDAASPDADPSAFCLVAADHGDVGAKVGSTSLGATTSTIVLDAGPPRDSFFLKLTSGMGVFSGGLATGTFVIDGAELSTTTCGLCVNLLADIGNMGPRKFYFATGGTVTLTATTPPAGSLTDVTLQEVTSGGAPIIGGCTTAIGAMSFTTQ